MQSKAPSEWDSFLEAVAEELCTSLFAAEVGSDLEAEITRETLKRRFKLLLEAGQASYHALRSYEHGNSATDLAKEACANWENCKKEAKEHRA